MEYNEGRSNLPELAFFALCILALLIFGIYWFFRPTDKVPRSNPNNPNVVYSKYTQSVTGLDDDRFKIVDLNKVYGGSVP